MRALRLAVAGGPEGPHYFLSLKKPRMPSNANPDAMTSAMSRVNHRSERGITVIDRSINDNPALTADCHDRSRNCAENGRRIS